MSLQTLVTDPKFKALSPAKQREVVIGVEPKAAGLSPEGYSKFIGGLSGESFTPPETSGGPPLGAGAEKGNAAAAEDLLPAAGGVIGGAAPLLLGPMGLLAESGAVGLGTGVGETARQFVRAARGKPVATTPLGAVGRSVESGAVAGASNVIFGGALRGFGALLTDKPLLSGLQKYAKETAAKMGWSPLMPTLSEAGAVIQAEVGNILNKMHPPQADVPLNKLEAQVRGHYSQEEQNLGVSSAPPLSETGGLIKEEAKGVLGTMGKQASKAQDFVSRNFGDKVSGLATELTDYIRKIFSARGMTLKNLTPGQREAFESAGLTEEEIGQVVDQLSEGKSPRLAADLKTTNKQPFQPLVAASDDAATARTYEGMKHLRTNLRDYANFDNPNPTPMQKIFRGAVGKVGDTLRRLADEGGFGQLHNETDAFYNEAAGLAGGEGTEGRVFNEIAKKNPEDLIDYIAGRNSVTEAKTAMSRFSPEGQSYIKRGVISRLLERSKDLKGAISPQKLTENLTILNENPEVLKTIFGKDHGAITALAEPANFLTDVAKISAEKVTGQSLSAEGRVLKNIADKNPEELVDYLVGNNSVTEAKTVMKHFSKEGQDHIKRSFLARLFQKSRIPKASSPSGEILAPEEIAGYLQTLHKNNPEVLKIIFGADYPLINNLRELAIAETAGLKGHALEDVAKNVLYRYHSISGLKNIVEKLRVPGEIESIIGRNLGVNTPAGKQAMKTLLPGGINPSGAFQKTMRRIPAVGIPPFINAVQDEEI